MHPKVDNLDRFKLETHIQLRFGDIDLMRHVNNARYLTFFEQARIDYMIRVLGWSGEANEMNIILANTNCDWLQPLFLSDRCVIKSRISHIGTKSFSMEYVVGKRGSIFEDTTDAAFSPVAYATAVLVGYDMQKNGSVPLPDSFKATVMAFEPTAPEVK